MTLWIRIHGRTLFPHAWPLLLLLGALLLQTHRFPAKAAEADPPKNSKTVMNDQPEKRAAQLMLPHIKKQILQNPVILKAIQRESTTNQGRTMKDIMELDHEWRHAKTLTRNMRRILTNDCSLVLRQMSEQSEIWGEILVIDDKGALVCSSGRTSDYYQGDEKKWTKVFPKDQDGLYISSPAFDASLDGFAMQLSMRIIDQDQAIGVVTVGLSLDPLMKRATSQEDR